MKNSKNLKNKAFKIFCSTVLICSILFFAISIWQVTNEILVNEMQRQCSLIINDAVEKAFKKVGTNLFEIQGTPPTSFMSINTYKVNTIRSTVSDYIYDKFDNHEYHTLKVHLGTVLCPYIFAGRGPYISVSMVPVSEVYVDLESVNQTYGINQVVNNIYVDVLIDVRAAGKINLSQTTVSTRIAAVQTLVTGDVPQTFVSVDKGGNTIAK